MLEALFWLAVVIAIAVIGAGIFVAGRAYLAGTSPAALLFKQRAEPRLHVVAFANVDSKRKLILVRRDDVEHLVMTGGPVDVVIETGIAARPAPSVETHSQADTMFTRPARTLGPIAARIEPEATGGS
jgi:hypothetical protein